MSGTPDQIHTGSGNRQTNRGLKYRRGRGIWSCSTLVLTPAKPWDWLFHLELLLWHGQSTGFMFHSAWRNINNNYVEFKLDPMTIVRARG